MKHLYFIRYIILLTFIFPATENTFAIKIKKELLYDKHTLADTQIYNDKIRVYQWDLISEKLFYLSVFQDISTDFGILQNYKNKNGKAPLVRNARPDQYRGMQDTLGTSEDQSVPLYATHDLKVPEIYGRDGSLVSIIQDSADFLKVRSINQKGVWLVPKKYVQRIGQVNFSKVIFVDRTNQNIAVMENADSVWLVRSMNPVTTGLRKPPYMRATPLGIFVLQRKIPEMIFYRDGSVEPGGFAPFASRFSNGAYLHGIPVNYPATKTIEFNSTLGTTPRSHMCVRNATSHAEFIYNWAPINETLVFVIE